MGECQPFAGPIEDNVGYVTVVLEAGIAPMENRQVSQARSIHPSEWCASFFGTFDRNCPYPEAAGLLQLPQGILGNAVPHCFIWHDNNTLLATSACTSFIETKPCKKKLIENETSNDWIYKILDRRPALMLL